MVLYNTMKTKDEKIPSFTAIILAGGKSSRMGSYKNKSMLRLNGKYLIDIVRSKLKWVVGDNIIIVGPPERYLSYKQVVPDLFSQKGPLAGIYSGLRASPSQYNIVVGCDMPFLEIKLLQYMTEDINSNDIVIPRYGCGYIEPLCAIYSKRCLEAIERNLSEHNFSVRAIFPHLKVKFVEDEDIKKYDPEFYSFFNINYKKDMIEAEKIINNRREGK
jgi:molybdopterin-guanine dinucleotide biosynthesis protein A